MKTIRALLAALFTSCLVAHADFALHDGDTVAFMGDSITAARGYTKIVEHYTLMRFPERKIRFFNAGWGGDTAAGALKRLQRDVFDRGATVVTVTFGVNDIGWGMKANDESKRIYLESLRSIIEECRAHGVRPIICSPAITAELPDKAEQGFLQRMTDEGLALAKSMGVETVDLQRGMREAQRRVVAANEKEKDVKKHTTLHVADGVHLNELGHLALAFALLKGLGAPEDVSAAEIDAGSAALTSVNGCHITDIRKIENGIAFVREDQGLPMTLGAFSAFNFRWVPVPQGIARYGLTVRNLPEAEYQIVAEGRLLGKVNAKHLAEGVNLAMMTSDAFQPGGPWDAQSLIVRELVEARDKLGQGERMESRNLPGHPQHEALQEALKKQDEEMVTLQRAMAKPYPYHFELRRVDAAAR